MLARRARDEGWGCGLGLGLGLCPEVERVVRALPDTDPR